jgi:hypothetical protein
MQHRQRTIHQPTGSRFTASERPLLLLLLLLLALPCSTCSMRRATIRGLASLLADTTVSMMLLLPETQQAEQ